MQDSVKRGANETGDPAAILTHLRNRKLPQMVDWLDPVMLAQVGMRTIVSSTLGQYADQRLMQAATDKADEAGLIARYNFAKGPDAIAPDAVWVDYVSDLGDGFEATFAMASLLAPGSLNVKGAGAPLPAGKILIMGGDQAYPQSSAQEYKDRLIDPYNWAFPLREGERAKRKLFALPGNHDWYDGLGAFDSLFCTVRNLIAKGKGNRIGGWECAQHRSYFAIRLPHDWWIWGADIQLDGVFDKAQRDYFHIMSEQALAGHKIVICLAEPSWLHERYENLLDIAYLARKHEAKVYAVLAGDLHHYSRFATPLKEAGITPLNVQFITCGGGGAFAHATHGLKSEVTLTWPEVEAEQTRGGAAARAKAAPSETERQPDAPLSRSPDFGRMGEKALASLSAPLAPGTMGFTDRLTGASVHTAHAPESDYKLRPAKIYPSRTTSRLLSLKNFWLPVRNWPFALFVGCVYFLYAWVFQTSIAAYDINVRLAEKTKLEAASAQEINDFLEPLSAGTGEENKLLAWRAMRSLERWRRAAVELGQQLTGVIDPKRDAAISALADRAVKFGKDWDYVSLETKQAILEFRKISPGGFSLTPSIEGALVAPFGPLASQYAYAIKNHAVWRSQKLAKSLKESAESSVFAARSIAGQAEKIRDDKVAGDDATRAAYNIAQYARSAEKQAAEFAGAIRPIDSSDVIEDVWEDIKDPNRVFIACLLNPAFFFLVLALWFGLVHYADAGTSRWRYLSKFVIGTAHFLVHMALLLLVSAAVGPHISPTESYGTAVAIASVFGMIVLAAAGGRAALVATPLALLFAIFIAGTDTGISYLSSAWNGFAQFYAGAFAETFKSKSEVWFWDTIIALWLNPYVLNFAAVLIFAFATIMLGGLLGAFIFGLYWAIMSSVFARHADDAFGALGLRHYKHFLRMRFEPDRLTIYPIAIDHVPGRSGWRAPGPSDPCQSNNPLIVPNTPLNPYLLEDPIVIEA